MKQADLLEIYKHWYQQHLKGKFNLRFVYCLPEHSMAIAGPSTNDGVAVQKRKKNYREVDSDSEPEKHTETPRSQTQAFDPAPEDLDLMRRYLLQLVEPASEEFTELVEKAFAFPPSSTYTGPRRVKTVAPDWEAYQKAQVYLPEAVHASGDLGLLVRWLQDKPYEENGKILNPLELRHVCVAIGVTLRDIGLASLVPADDMPEGCPDYLQSSLLTRENFTMLEGVCADILERLGQLKLEGNPKPTLTLQSPEIQEKMAAYLRGLSKSDPFQTLLDKTFEIPVSLSWSSGREEELI